MASVLAFVLTPVTYPDVASVLAGLSTLFNSSISESSLSFSRSSTAASLARGEIARRCSRPAPFSRRGDPAPFSRGLARMAMARLLADVASWINEKIVLVLDKGQKLDIMSIADEIVTYLLQNDLAYMLETRLDAVGIHPDNRFGAVLDPSDVYALLQKIATRGWSWPKVSLARAFEKADGAAGQAQAEKNVQVAEASAGAIPLVNPADIMILSTGCSHTSSALRCVDQGGKPPKEDKFWAELCDSAGRLPREKFLEKYQSFTKPLTNGLNWVVIRREVEVLCPRLPLLLQEAGNTEHGVEQKSTKMQIMMSIHAKSVRDIRVHGKANWESIAKEAHRKCTHTERNNQKQTRTHTHTHTRSFRAQARVISRTMRCRFCVVSTCSDIYMYMKGYIYREREREIS